MNLITTSTLSNVIVDSLMENVQERSKAQNPLIRALNKPFTHVRDLEGVSGSGILTSEPI